MSTNSNFQSPPPLQPFRQAQSPKVTFGNVLSLVFSKYAVGSGRASLSEYWFFVLWNVVIYFSGLVLIALFALVDESLGAVASGLWLVAQVALIIPSFTTSVRRLHDTGKSAHFLWLAFIPLAGIALLVFYATPSQIGPNKYGEQPV